MARKKNEEIIPPDVESPAADKAENINMKIATDNFQKILDNSLIAYGKLFEQAQGQFSKLADASKEVFETLLEQGEKVEAKVKEKLEEAHVTDKAKDLAQKAEEFAKKAEEQAKEFRNTHFSDEKIAELKKNFNESISPINVFAMAKHIETLEARVAELEAQLAQKAAPIKAAAAKTTTRKTTKKSA